MLASIVPHCLVDDCYNCPNAVLDYRGEEVHSLICDTCFHHPGQPYLSFLWRGLISFPHALAQLKIGSPNILLPSCRQWTIIRPATQMAHVQNVGSPHPQTSTASLHPSNVYIVFMVHLFSSTLQQYCASLPRHMPHHVPSSIVSSIVIH